MSVNPSSSNHNYGTDWSPSVSTPPINVAAVSPATTDVCEPVYEDVEEIGFTPKSGITCSFVPGGLLFISTGELPLKIHSADGKVVYSGNLRKGDNRIDLKVGVYFWGTGIYRGKAVVR